MNLKTVLCLSLFFIMTTNVYSQITSAGGCPKCKLLVEDQIEGRQTTPEEKIQLEIVKNQENALAGAVEKQWRIVSKDPKSKVTNFSEVLVKLAVLYATSPESDCDLRTEQLQKLLTPEIKARIKIFVGLPLVEIYLNAVYDMNDVSGTFKLLRKMAE